MKSRLLLLLSAFTAALFLLGIAGVGFHSLQASGATVVWRSVAATPAPAPRAGHKVLFDPVNQKVVLFGGQSPTGALLNDVWEFDSQTETWTDVTPVGTPMPSGRSRFGMAFDSARSVFVAYGGYVGGSPGTSDETWEWNPAVRRWTFRGYAGAIDFAGRIGAELAFDPVRQQVLLFGGLPYWECPTNGGTYAWTGTAWQLVDGGGPSGRAYHRMVTDPQRGKVVLYGGAYYDCGATTDFADTWEWDGSSWTKMADAPNRPSTNRGVALAYDAGAGTVLAFGGYGSNETWEWNGLTWDRQPSLDPPTARMTSFTYDPIDHSFVLFGGSVGGFPFIRATGVAGGVGETWLATRRTHTVLAVSPGSGPYLGTASVRVTLNRPDGESVPGRVVSVTFGDPASEFSATTDLGGVATVDIALGELIPGEYPMRVSFTGDAEYEAAADIYSTLTITSRVPQLTWNTPAAITYGVSIGGAQLNATADVRGSFVYTPGTGTVLNAGTHALTTTFTPDDPGYATIEKSVMLLVTPVTPVVNWTPPAAIVYRTPLSATQLNATATVAGTFQYSPAAGTVLDAGVNQVLSVTFSPEDASNYTATTRTTTITVTRAVPSIEWPTPNPIVYGTPLSATQLNAVADVAGTFVYSPPTGFVFQGGTATLLATFTPTDTRNYTNATAARQLVILPAQTATSLTASRTSLTAGQPVVLTATLAVPTSAFNGVPMQFLDGGTLLGTASAFQIGGVLTATLTRTFLTDSGSPHTLTATFAGNNSLQSSVSSGVPLEVISSPFQYAVVELGTFGGRDAAANGVNSRGDIVGYASFTDESSHAFWYDNGRMNDLGTLGGRTSSAAAINDLGQIVGQSETATGAVHAFLWSGGVMTDLGTLGGESSVATGINDRGDVVGYSYLAGTAAPHAFLYRSGAMIDLGTLGGTNSNAVGVDAAGRVVANSATPGNAVGTTRVFIWDNGVKQDIGTLGGTETFARSVSPDGVIVGESSAADGRSHGFVYANGLFTDLGAITATLRPAAVNRSGQVAGFNQWVTLSEQHGTIVREGLIVDLNSYLPLVTPWRYLGEARAINDNGILVGYGYFPDNTRRTRAYALYPLTLSGLTVTGGTSTFGDPVTLEARLAATGTAVAGKTLRFSVSGKVGTATTDATGLATLTLAGVLTAGPHVVEVSFAGDTTLTASNSEATITIAPAMPLVTWSPPAPIVYGTPLGSNELDATASVNGTFTYTPAAGTLLAAGTGQTLTLTFTPEDSLNYTAISTSVTVDVLKAAPRATLAVPSRKFLYGETITLQAQVDSQPLGVTGFIAFYADGQLLQKVSASSGFASILVNSLAVGVHEIWADYTGDANFDAARSSSQLITVDRGNTSIDLVASPAASVFGEDVVLTASVAVLGPASGVPTGVVRFADDTLHLQDVPIVIADGAAVASLRLSSFQTGTHGVTAEYLGDDRFFPSASSTLAYTVAPAQTGTTLSVAPNPAGYGQPVTLRALVAPLSPGAGIAAGVVDFFEGLALLGSAPLDANAAASLVVNGLAPGTHSISGRYNGSASHSASGSAEVIITVESAAASTTTSLASSKNPSAVGEGVTFTATVAPISGSGLPSGTVRFFDGTEQIGQSSLVLSKGAMRAILTVATFTAATHSITAQYVGDGTFNGSATFSPLLQSVGATTAATSTSVTANPNPASFGTGVMLTATVKAPGGGRGPSPSGKVHFFADGNPIGPSDGVTLIPGKNGSTATLPAVQLARGYHAIVAQYVGDAAYSPSSSQTLVLQVQ
jgi:probable HAF family extracellular repeat protein